MAVRYVAPVATGNGSGNDTSNRMTLTSALSVAAAGDIVKIAFGYYTNTMNPTNAGTSNSARITFEAEDSANKPIITGASTASNGQTAPAALNTGWSNNGTGLVNGVLSYGGSGFNSSGSAHPYVYRRTGFSSAVNGVWVNHPTDTVSGAGTTTPTGYYHSLWRMHQDQTYSNQVPRNPDLRIHDPNEQTTGDDAGTGFYMRHDWQAQCRWNGAAGNTWGFPADSLDVRLHSTTNPNPNNWNIFVTTKGRVLDLVKNYITFRNLIFKHWAGMQTNATNFTMDGCEVHQMANDALNIALGSHNAQIINCRIIGGGAWMHHGHDTMYISDSNDCLVQGCEIAYGAHGGLTTLGAVANLTVRGNTFHNTGTALSAQKPGCTNWLVENNTFYNSAFIEEINILKTPHPAIEIDWMNGAMIRRNRFMRCSYGLLIQCPANSGGSVTGIDFRHNTIVDCQIASVRIQTDGGLAHDNQFRNNILVGPSGGHITPRSTYLYGGHGANVNFDGSFSNSSTGDNNTFRNNLYYERVPPDGIVPLGAKVFSSGTNFASVLGGSGAANSLPNIFGPTSFNGLGSDTDPLFVNLAGDNLALQSGSPAIGKGLVLTNPSEPGTDLGYAQFSGGGGVTNLAPAVDLRASVTSGTAPLAVTFTANAHDQTNSDGTKTQDANLAYSWNFGDGSSLLTGTGTSFDQPPAHNYANPGNYTCSVTVTDTGSPTASTTDTIGVSVSSGSSGGEITSGLTIVNSFGVNGVDQTGQGPGGLIDRAWLGNGGVAGTNNWARSGLIAAVQGVIIDIGRTVTLVRCLVQHYPGGGGTREYNYTLATSATNTAGSYTDLGTRDTDRTVTFTELSFAPRANVRYIKLTVNASIPAGYDFASFMELIPYEQSSSVNVAPTLNLTSNVSTITPGQSVTFTSGAADPNNTDGSAGTLAANLVYAWDFGDGQTSNGTGTTFASRTHTYAAAGTFTCTVRVTDTGTPALFTDANKQITVTGGSTPTNNPPNVNLQTTPSPANIAAGGNVTFTANAHDQVDSSGGGFTADANLSYVWDFGDGTGISGQGTAFDVRNAKVYSTAGTYVCTVTVSDNGTPTGPVLSTSKQVTVTVGGGGSNVWAITDSWDNLNTPSTTPFAPSRTLFGRIVTDGYPSDRWVSPFSITSGQTFIAWDMGQNRAVKRLRWYLAKSLNGYSYVVTAQYSTDKVNWTNVPGISNTTTPVGVSYAEYVLGNAISARYVRLVFNSSTFGLASVLSPRFSDS